MPLYLRGRDGYRAVASEPLDAQRTQRSCLGESSSNGVKLVVGVLKATMYAVAGLPCANHPCLDLALVIGGTPLFSMSDGNTFLARDVEACGYVGTTQRHWTHDLSR